MLAVVGTRSKTVFDLYPSDLLGQGREGKVYEAGGRCVKVLSDPLPPDEVWAVETVVRVGQSVPGFAWPVEPVADPGTGDVVGVVMPLAAGVNLEDVLDRRGTADWGLAEKVVIATGVASAVAAAHAVTAPKVVLGDVIKAGNLLVDQARPTFVDAASVCLLGYRAADGSVTDHVPGLSTPGYVPKEVLDNPDLMPAHTADLFAVAVLLFELLMGTKPSDPRPCPAAVGLDPDEAVREGIFPRYARHPDFRPPRYDLPDLPDEIDRLFRSAFMAAPHERPTAEQWVRALKDWFGTSVAPPAAPPPPPPPRRVWLPLPSRAVLDRVLTAGLVVAGLLTAARWVATDVVPYWTKTLYPEPVIPVVTPPPPPRPLPRIKVGPDFYEEVFE